jgi:hypothetical protein
VIREVYAAGLTRPRGKRRPGPQRPRRRAFLARFGAGNQASKQERIVAKHLADAYHSKLARKYEIINASYTQHRGRAEWLLDRRGRHVHNGR